MFNKLNKCKVAARQLFIRTKLLKSNIYRVVRKFLLGFIAVSIINFTYSYFFYTPKVYSLIKENNELFLKLQILQDKISSATDHVFEIESRNDNIYKTILGVDIGPTQTPSVMYGDEKLYEDSRYADLIDDAWSGVSDLSHRLFIQSISFDTLQLLSSDKGKILESLPAIWPIDKNDFRRISSYFGNRTHPIFKYRHFHKGLDLSAPKHSPIYATASGVVVLAGWNKGYGNNVVLEHGYGYKTRYAHANKLIVKRGDVVSRGELIAEVGNTGNSTSDHLHYEVLYKNIHINPLSYLGKDMSAEDFYRIINEANKLEGEKDE